MANEVLLRDGNHVTVLGAITDDSTQEVRMLRVDPVTNRVLASVTGSGTSPTGSGTTDTLTYWTGTNTLGSVTLGGGLTFVGGTLTATASGGTPGGSTTQLQYNDAGAFGGITGATTNGTVVVLTSPTITTGITPTSNDGAALGTGALSFSDLFLATGGVINIGNGNWIATHSSNILTVGSGDDLRLTTAGTNTTSVVTVGGTQTLTAKTLTAPVIATIVNTGTLTLPTSTDTLVARATTDTLTNKRITRRLITVNAPGATPTTNTDNTDIAKFTGLATAITSMTTNLSGTPVEGDYLMFQFLDDGTARAITWGASFSATTIALPTTTVISTLLRVGFQWNGSTWACIATC